VTGRLSEQEQDLQVEGAVEVVFFMEDSHVAGAFLHRCAGLSFDGPSEARTMPENPSIVVQKAADGGWTLSLVGELSVFRAAELQLAAQRIAMEDNHVVVECDRLQTVDLAALQILLSLQRTLTAQARGFRMTGLSRPLVDMMALAGMKEGTTPP
jgi:anti-anti-sigma regulatory factor